jgi:hypothetical protein
MQGGYQQYDYEDVVSLDKYDLSEDKLNLLEIGVILFCILSIIGVFIFGFVNQSTKNRDTQRLNDISQILLALDSFYQNSSIDPSQKYYPIASCSAQLNEVDFEYSLKQYLTGKRIEKEPHQYINPSNFPKDPWGMYSQKPNQRKIKLRDCPKVFSEVGANSDIYTDQGQSCNFDRKLADYRKCYLYTSSSNGDKFELAYYSEQTGTFMVYSRFQNLPLRTESVAS